MILHRNFVLFLISSITLNELAESCSSTATRAASKVQLNADAKLYLRCNVGGVRICSDTAEGCRGGTQVPHDQLFNKMHVCNQFNAYHVCFNLVEKTSYARPDIPSCQANELKIGNYWPDEATAVANFPNKFARCVNGSGDVTCRPGDVTAVCPLPYRMVDSTQVFPTVANCEAPLFGCRPCYVASNAGYTVTAAQDYEFTPCSNGLLLSLTGETYHRGSNKATVDTYCTGFYVGSLALPHIRCKNDAAVGDVFCRPVHASGCPAGETRINNSQTFNTLSECQLEYYACQTCYVANIADGTYSVTAYYDHETSPCSGKLMSATPSYKGSDFAAVTGQCQGYYTNTIMVTHVRCYNAAAAGKVVCRPLYATTSGCPVGELRLNATESFSNLQQCTANKQKYVSCYYLSTNSYSCTEDWECSKDFGGDPDENRVLTAYTVASCNDLEDFVPSPWYRCIYQAGMDSYVKCRPVNECWTGVAVGNPEKMNPNEDSYLELGYENYFTNTKYECENIAPYISCYKKNSTANEFTCIEDYEGPCESYNNDYDWLPSNRYFVSESSCHAFRPVKWLRCIDDTLEEDHCRPYDATSYANCANYNVFFNERAPDYGTTEFSNFGSCNTYVQYVSCYDFGVTTAADDDANFHCVADYEMCDPSTQLQIPNDFNTTLSSCNDRYIPNWIRCAFDSNDDNAFDGVVCRPYDSENQEDCPDGEEKMPGPVFTSFATCDDYDARKSCYPVDSTDSDEVFTCTTSDYQDCTSVTHEQVPSSTIFSSEDQCTAYRHNAWIRCYSQDDNEAFCRPYQTGGVLDDCDNLSAHNVSIPDRVFGTRNQCKAYEHYWICYVEADNDISCRPQSTATPGNCDDLYPAGGLPYGNSTECENALALFEYVRCRTGDNEIICRPEAPGCIAGETESVMGTSYSYQQCIDAERTVFCYVFATNSFECRSDVEDCSADIEFRFPTNAAETYASCTGEAPTGLSGEYYRCVLANTVVCRPTEVDCLATESAEPTSHFDSEAECLGYSPTGNPTLEACYDDATNQWSCVETCSDITLDTLDNSTDCNNYLFVPASTVHTDWIRCNSNNGRYCAPYESDCSYDGATALPGYQSTEAIFSTKTECEDYVNIYSCYNYLSNSFKCEYDYTGCGTVATETIRLPLTDYATLSACTNSGQTAFIRCVDARTGLGTVCRPEGAQCSATEVRSPAGVTYGTLQECYATKLYYMCYSSSSPAVDNTYAIKCRTDEIGCNDDACGVAWLNSTVCEAPVRFVPSPTSGIEFNAFNTKTACETVAWYRCRSGTNPNYVYKCRPRGGEVEEDGDEINNGCATGETRVPDNTVTYLTIASCLAG